MKNLESTVKSRIEVLSKILEEYESLNRDSKCRYIAHERDLEKEITVLEELVNNIDSSKKWAQLLERDRDDATLK